jgi:hypothetical protein
LANNALPTTVPNWNAGADADPGRVGYISTLEMGRQVQVLAAKS